MVKFPGLCSPDPLAENNQCNIENCYVMISYILGILHAIAVTLRTYFVSTICPLKFILKFWIFRPEETFFSCSGCNVLRHTVPTSALIGYTRHGRGL